MASPPAQDHHTTGSTARAEPHGAHDDPMPPPRSTSRFCEVDTHAVLINSSGNVVEAVQFTITTAYPPHQAQNCGPPPMHLACGHHHGNAMMPLVAAYDQPPPMGAFMHGHLCPGPALTPGWESELFQDNVDDGLPHMGTTTFDFRISWPIYNGLGEEDGTEICKAVDWLVKNMIADKTFRRSKEIPGENPEQEQHQQQALEAREGAEETGAIESASAERGGPVR